MQKRLTDSIRRLRGENARPSAWLTAGLAATALSIGAVGFGLTLPYTSSPGRTLEPLPDVAGPARVTTYSPPDLAPFGEPESAASPSAQNADSGARVALQPTATSRQPDAPVPPPEVRATVSAAGAPNGAGVEPLPPAPSPPPSPSPSPTVTLSVTSAPGVNGQTPPASNPNSTTPPPGGLIPAITTQPTAITPSVPVTPGKAAPPTEGQRPGDAPSTGNAVGPGTAPRRPTASPTNGQQPDMPEIVILDPAEAR